MKVGQVLTCIHGPDWFSSSLQLVVRGTGRNRPQPLMQPYATSCVRLWLQLHTLVEFLRLVSVRLRQKRQKNQTGPDFKTLEACSEVFPSRKTFMDVFKTDQYTEEER